jgi:hypothetical protein
VRRRHRIVVDLLVCPVVQGLGLMRRPIMLYIWVFLALPGLMQVGPLMQLPASTALAMVSGSFVCAAAPEDCQPRAMVLPMGCGTVAATCISMLCDMRLRWQYIGLQRCGPPTDTRASLEACSS